MYYVFMLIFSKRYNLAIILEDARVPRNAEVRSMFCLHNDSQLSPCLVQNYQLLGFLNIFPTSFLQENTNYNINLVDFCEQKVRLCFHTHVCEVYSRVLYIIDNQQMLVSCPQNCNITLMLTSSDGEIRNILCNFLNLRNLKYLSFLILPCYNDSTNWEGSCLSKLMILADSGDVNGSYIMNALIILPVFSLQMSLFPAWW